MVKEISINAELIKSTFGIRGENETVTEYAKKIIKKLEEENGFTQFHQDINKILKKLVTKDELQYVASRITGYEGQWLTAVSEFLTNKIDANKG